MTALTKSLLLLLTLSFLLSGCVQKNTRLACFKGSSTCLSHSEPINNNSNVPCKTCTAVVI